ncbi:hypothetical protein AD939_01160 [Gluconobacter oxydans]|nr:hypothetical protein AD939_01160 [Gluconobacter oxydans]
MAIEAANILDDLGLPPLPATILISGYEGRAIGSDRGRELDGTERSGLIFVLLRRLCKAKERHK